jgi:hypothetical protein
MAIDGLDPAKTGKTGLPANDAKIPNAIAAWTKARARGAQKICAIRDTTFQFDSTRLTVCLVPWGSHSSPC